MATNTTWAQLASDLKSQLENCVQDGKFRVSSVTNPDGITSTFYSYDQLMKFYLQVMDLAQGEAPTTNTIKSAYKPIVIQRTRI